MPTAYEAGKSALGALITWVDANVSASSRNEATTRLHLIDQLLMNVLQWDRTSVRSEEPAGSGRIDYSCGTPAALFILEAKREGIYFDLPAGSTCGVHSIDSLIAGSAGKPLGDALRQVIEYAAANGVGLAGVTNGHQLVLLLASRTDGTPPLKGRALVFPSLEDMLSDFRLLWDNASKLGIEERRLYQTLQGRVAPTPRPLSSTLPNYPGTKRRNSLQVGLEILGELFLEDVARLDDIREDFLADCYASSGALSQYAEISKQILTTRYALLRAEGAVEAEPVTTKKGLATQLTQDMLVAAASRRPIVLLGDVGVGKTMFIQRLVNIDAQDIFKDAFSLYIDFGSSTTLTRLDTFVVEECIRQLYVKYTVDVDDAAIVDAVYNGQLNRFDRSHLGRLRDLDQLAYEREKIHFLRRLTEDRANHLRSVLQHVRTSWRKQVVIFLDNIDQRSSADQEQVFLIANELANTWPATVFVTLRPETFYRSSRSGALSGYQPRVFTISPPRTDVMLQKRVDFALKQIRETGRFGSFPVGVTVDSDSLNAFLEVLSQNFKSNDHLLTLIENIAGGNMRLALQFVTEFIGSGHVNTTKILDIYGASGKYTIAVHEFLRAIMFGDGEYYDPDSSPIANLLRVTRPDGREHFLLPLLLSQLQSLGERFSHGGYVRAEELYSFAQGLGFDDDQVSSALHYATSNRMMDASPRFIDNTTSLSYRITTVGAYTTRTLLGYFAYLDAICVDTPILDPAYAQLINDAKTLTERVSRADYFRIYLDKQWTRIVGSSLPWDWPATSSTAADDIRRVGSVADPSAWSHAPRTPQT